MYLKGSIAVCRCINRRLICKESANHIPSLGDDSTQFFPVIQTVWSGLRESLIHVLLRMPIPFPSLYLGWEYFTYWDSEDLGETNPSD
jgi:hypothetical protein